MYLINFSQVGRVSDGTKADDRFSGLSSFRSIYIVEAKKNKLTDRRFNKSSDRKTRVNEREKRIFLFFANFLPFLCNQVKQRRNDRVIRGLIRAKFVIHNIRRWKLVEAKL